MFYPSPATGASKNLVPETYDTLDKCWRQSTGKLSSVSSLLVGIISYLPRCSRCPSCRRPPCWCPWTSPSRPRTAGSVCRRTRPTRRCGRCPLRCPPRRSRSWASWATSCSVPAAPRHVSVTSLWRWTLSRPSCIAPRRRQVPDCRPDTAARSPTRPKPCTVVIIDSTKLVNIYEVTKNRSLCWRPCNVRATLSSEALMSCVGLTLSFHDAHKLSRYFSLWRTLALLPSILPVTTKITTSKTSKQWG